MTFDQQFSRMSDEELKKEIQLAQKYRGTDENTLAWRQALLKEDERRGNLYHGGKSAAEDVDQIETNALAELVNKHGLVCVLDMLNEYCAKKQDEAAKLDHPGARNWYYARAHIEHCSNKVEMLNL